MNTSEMDADTRDEVKIITKEARMQLRAQVQLIPQLVDDEDKTTHVKRKADGLLAELLKTSVANAPAADG